VRRPLLLFLLFAVISILTRAPFFGVEILDMDESAHAVGSWTLLDGGKLYQDFVNNKPPLLYVYYAAVQAIFGRGLLQVHLFTALIVVPLTALAVAAFFDYDKKGLYGGILYLLISAAFLAHDMHSTNAEILMVLPGTWAIVFAKRNRMFLSGLLFGLGFLLKYQIALGILAILFANRKGTKMGILALFAGFLLPLIGSVAYFYATGGGESLFYWLFWNNLLYSANPISFHEAIGRAATYLLPFLIVTAPLWWVALKNRSNHFIFVLLLLSIPPMFVGFRFYPHYFIQLYFPLVILCAPVEKRNLLVYSMALLICFTAVNFYLYFGKRDIYRERDPVYQEVAQRLKSDPSYKDATLFVWGYAPAFYYYAHLKPATRFVVMGQARLTGYVSGNLGSVNKPTQGVAQHWDWLMQDLQKNKATYILDTSPAAIYRWDHYPISDYPRLKNYIDQNYTRLDEIDSVVIYVARRPRPRSSAGDGPAPLQLSDR